MRILCRSVSLRSLFNRRGNMSPGLKRQGRFPSGYNSANAESDGSSRKFWIGFKSASRAEISHHSAPDDGVIGRGGNVPPSFLPDMVGDTEGDTQGDTVSPCRIFNSSCS